MAVASVDVDDDDGMFDDKSEIIFEENIKINFNDYQSISKREQYEKLNIDTLKKIVVDKDEERLVEFFKKHSNAELLFLEKLS